ncbi:Ribonuclease BN [Candidatus Filomicrobium marinum]|uniref:Ribonuclease BN n=2 Tax=Filomicrobium TaxID=119044 RepID=A0A0D6JEA0_9HYPH|nr:MULTISPECIES: YihY/virulence factor BrkB family protein [Filomicrobium]MCV0368216.1 YihY/virulence factor BrkB family protein [Filomicrobium sp.]CFX13921.1 Ribonuclease BN [Candidatus Filomicrobium marinum]CPR17689.1 Ribonuclease BN [Candidatus Filomicrobium marinum]SDO29738.1 membrane protein [Filomicrobium insigne]
MQQHQPFLKAIYELYEHSGFSMAGAVAFSFVVSLFPFCIFLTGLAGLIGSPELAGKAVTQLFQVLPRDVAQALAPQVVSIMSSTRIDLLTVGGGIALFFATSAIETLRAALNGAYRVRETLTYPLCLLRSMLFVLILALSMLVLTWAVIVGPAVAARFEPSWVKSLLDSTWLAVGFRYGLAAIVIATQLLALHLWLVAGERSLADVLPGILLSTLLWIGAGAMYSYYLEFSDYSRFYAGLSQLMVAMIFFQVTAVIIILGAELNRGLIELRKLSANGETITS